MRLKRQSKKERELTPVPLSQTTTLCEEVITTIPHKPSCRTLHPTSVHAPLHLFLQPKSSCPTILLQIFKWRLSSFSLASLLLADVLPNWLSWRVKIRWADNRGPPIGYVMPHGVVWKKNWVARVSSCFESFYCKRVVFATELSWILGVTLGF